MSSEHLKYGGPAICVWLKKVFNAIADLEVIPPSLNHGLITPIPKGKGHDPTNPSSYRGITLTSIIAKCLEKIILDRMLPMLEDYGFPHPSQTAYINDRSCIDGIFLTNEVMLKLLQNGDSPYLCLYDLEEAFDSVEYLFSEYASCPPPFYTAVAKAVPVLGLPSECHFLQVALLALHFCFHSLSLKNTLVFFFFFLGGMVLLAIIDSW